MMNLPVELAKHAREFLGALRQYKYEKSDDGGVFFPRQKTIVSGIFSHRVRGGEWSHDPNLDTTEGLNFILDNFVSSHAAIPLYLAPYAGAISPTLLWTASNFASTASEIVSGAEGYSEGTRQLWVSAAATAQTKDNYASVAVFTIVTATALAVNGAGLLTASAKGATTGALISAVRFAAARSFGNTDLFDLKFQLAMTSS